MTHRTFSFSLKKRILVGLPLLVTGIGLAVATLVWSPDDVESTRRPSSDEWVPRISAMGAIARGDVPRPVIQQTTRRGGVPHHTRSSNALFSDIDVLVNDLFAEDFQAETSLAVDGNVVVVGYNDMRGFANPQVSVCGFGYSVDAGTSFIDGGQLPTAGSGDEVLGDPDVKAYNDGITTTFYYSSLYRTDSGENSLCLHTSIDGGATWQGPFEVTVATSATDFPDKPLMSVDPDDGRILLAWTNFGTTVDVRVAYSDDEGQTWSNPTVFPSVGQGAVPRTNPGSSNAYIAWLSGGTIQLAKSTDGGANWGTPFTVADDVVVPRTPWGSDRINAFPSLAVRGPKVHVAWAAFPENKSGDGSDIFVISSTDAAGTFSDPVRISDNRNGADRHQFFPYLAIDSSSNDAVAIVYYDQVLGADNSQNTDLTDVFVAVSTDDGANWECPLQLTDRSFHAEHGNTSTSANLGEYIQAVFEGGALYTAFAKTDMPMGSTFAPDTYFDTATPLAGEWAPIRVSTVTFNETGCNAGNGQLEPGEVGELTVFLQNFSGCTPRMRNGVATLTTTNPSVTIEYGMVDWDRIGVVGDIESNGDDPFIIRVAKNGITDPFVEFQLDFVSDEGSGTVYFSLEIGEVAASILLSEQFEGVAAPALPAGWSTETVSGATNDWQTTSDLSTSGLNSAFCADVAETSHNRLSSPSIAAGNADEWVLTYNISYDLENDGPRHAWDGAALMIEIDGVVHQAASMGTMTPFYGHTINEGDPLSLSLPGTAAWSGKNYPSFTQVTTRFRGLDGAQVRFMWDLATDFTGSTPRGAWVDDVTFSAVQYASPATLCSDLVARPETLDLGVVQTGITYCDSFFVVNQNPFFSVDVDSVRTDCDNPPISVDSSRVSSTIAAGDSVPIIVCVTPTTTGSDQCEITIHNTSGNETVTVAVTWDATTLVTGINDGTPAPFEIRSVAPNPFNPTTTVRFTLPQSLPVTADVWAVDGSRVRTLAHNQVFSAGVNSIDWNGLNDAGEPVASGVYFIRVQNRLGSEVARAVLLK